MEYFGNFWVENELLNEHVDFLAINDEDDELFRTLDTSLFDCAAYTAVNYPDLNIKMNAQLKKEEDGNQYSSSRFKNVNESDMMKLEEAYQSNRTRKNTKWAVKIFQGTQFNKILPFT